MTWEYWLCIIFLIIAAVYFVIYEINWQWEGFDKIREVIKKKGHK